MDNFELQKGSFHQVFWWRISCFLGSRTVHVPGCAK